MLAAQSYYKLSGFLLLTVMSRKLGTSDIGTFFFAVAFAESFLVLASFSLNPVMSRRVATDPVHAKEHFAPLLGFRSLSSPVWLVAIIVAGAALTSAPWQVLAAAAVMTLIEDVYFSFGALFIALRKVKYNVAVGVTVHTLFLAGFLFAMETRPSLSGLFAVHLFRAIALALVAVVLTQWRVFHLEWKWDSAYVRAGVPFVLIALVHAGRDQVGTLLLGFLAGYEAVAQYNLAFRVLSASLFIPTAICAILVPILAADKLSAANRQLLSRLALAVSVAGAAIGVVVWFFADSISNALYGPIAGAVTPVLRLLSVVFPVSFLALFMSLVLQALYQERRVLVALVAATVMSVALNVTLIPIWGARGAIIAQMLASVTQLVLLGWIMLAVVRHPERAVEGFSA